MRGVDNNEDIVEVNCAVELYGDGLRSFPRSTDSDGDETSESRGELDFFGSTWIKNGLIE